MSALTISYKAPLYVTGFPSPDGSRRLFSGVPEDIAGDTRTFAAIGARELIFDFPRPVHCGELSRVEAPPAQQIETRAQGPF